MQGSGLRTGVGVLRETELSHCRWAQAAVTSHLTDLKDRAAASVEGETGCGKNTDFGVR